MVRLTKGAVVFSRCSYALLDCVEGGTSKGSGRRFIKRRIARLIRRQPIEMEE